MNTLDVVQGGGRHERLRLLMLLVIAATMPFYCFALYIIGSAPAEVELSQLEQTETALPPPTFTPLGANLYATAEPTAEPLFPTHTPLSLPVSAPLEIVPPTPLVVPTEPPTATMRPRVATDDRDYDGVRDAQDQCPDTGGFVDAQGCPYDDDGDRDGFRDGVDACPDEYAPGTARGCQDFDDDGLDTADDDCLQQFGARTNRGCP